MGINKNISDAGSIFKFERFYQTLFVVETTDANGVAVEGYPATVTINGNITTSEYYTNSDNQITSFSTAYAAAYYINGEEKTAEEVKNAINANTSTLTVTVKPRPFIASTNETPAYYALMISDRPDSWLEGSGTDVNCDKDRALPDINGRTNWMWQLMQDGTNGYRIYNVGTEKYIGGRTATGGYLTLVDAASANSFIAVYDNATIKFKDKTNSLWIDRNNGNTYAHTSGQQFTFKRMYKVTFSEAVAVNGGDAVSTIYVAADGNESFTLPSDKLYRINGAEAVGYIEAARTIATCSSDIDVTVSESPTKNVTYILNWSDGSTIETVENVTTNLLNPSSNFLPISFANDFVTLSYSPAEITSETSEVVVTATWNGPFQLSSDVASAKWYTVGIHATYEAANHIWKYDSGNSDIIATEAVATNAYASLSDKNYFCFVGNPYDGFSIYNKAAGSSMTLFKSTTNEEHAKMATKGSLFVPDAPSEDGNIADGYACFKLKNSNVRLNCYDSDSYNVNGWTDSGNGSTCWFKTPSSYPLNFLDAYVLTAPAGVVGTVDVAEDVMTYANDLKTYMSNEPFYFATAKIIDLLTLNKLAAASEITLGDGYYQIVSANPDFVNQTGTRRRMIFNGSAIGWSDDMNANNINGIFKLTSTEGDNAYSIYSGNGQNYLSNGGGALGASTAVTITEAASGTAQYSLYLAEGYNGGHHYLHTLGHTLNNVPGSGTSGNLTAWNAGANSASAWYIMPVNSVDLTLNDGRDGNYYATLCLPFDVTLSGCDAYTMTLSGNFLVPSKEAITPVPAGTPVLLRGTTAKATAQIAATAATGAPLTTTDLRGCYVPTLVSDVSVDGKKVYTLGYMEGEDGGVGFYRYTGSSIRANGAYLLLDASSQVRGFRFDFGGTDAITHVVTPTKPDAPLYDLQGRRVGNATHGIYIQNGKKILK